MNDLRCVHAAGAELGEGLCWSPGSGTLYWVDILGRRLHRYRPSDGACEAWDFDEEITAVAERRDAPGLVVTLRRGMAFVEPGAAPRHVWRPSEEPRGNRFNDGKCDRAGRFWAGTMDFDCRAPSGALWRCDADGTVVRHAVGYPVTNGPTWSKDGRSMYFNDTVHGFVNAFEFDEVAGTIANPRPWLRFAAGDGVPDGMTTDADGRLWIAHWGGACVTCHDPLSGAELRRIALPTDHVTNCAFGGADLRTLYITTARSGLSAEQLAQQPLAGGLFAIALDVQGVAPNLYAG